MKILAFETATEACSVALWLDGEVRERHALAPRQHAQLALPWADALLAEAGIARAQLDLIAVGRGPGAFTGVRLAISLAQGVALGLDRPVVAVSTLAVLAQGANESPGESVVAAIDARMGEIYLGTFRRGGDGLMRACGDEWLGPPGAPPQAIVADYGVGTGFAAADGVLIGRLGLATTQCLAAALPHAAHCAQLASAAWSRGEGLAAEQVEPAYLRHQIALTLEQQLLARTTRRA